MKNKKVLFFILLCVGAFVQAQETVRPFEEFFVEGMKKIDGVFPVYVADGEVYLEIPSEYIGREMQISAQIDRGFDLLCRPANGLGVVRITSPTEGTVCFQQPFYMERILDTESVYQQAFSLSNVQPEGISHSVVSYSGERGAIIRITEYLLNGDEWFSYQYSFIRSLVPALSEVVRIHPFDEGVSFTVKRYHGVEAERYMYSSSAIVLPDGSMPLEVTCVLRLLPQKKDRIRLADNRIPYRTLHFKDYSQDPYCMVEDSLVLRWDLAKPLTFYVDTLFPQEYFKAVKSGVEAWNGAFRKAGLRHPVLQVKYADRRVVSAEQSAFISYDLRMPGVKSSLTHHPRTGEILSCRLNIGHGFMKGLLDNYLLTCGATDSRIRTDRYSKEVAKELLQNEVTKEVGHLLGLSEVRSKAVCNGPLKVGEEDERAIYFGYVPLKGTGNCYDEREKLRRWLGDFHTVERPEDYAVKIVHLQTVLSQLDKIVYKEKAARKSSLLRELYRKAIQLYASYLAGIAENIREGQPAEVQHQAMMNLDKYLFHPTLEMECDYVKANLLENRNDLLYPEVRKLFKRLLQKNYIRCGYPEFFQDLYKGLFNGFNSELTISYAQLDIQLLCLEAWLDVVRGASGEHKYATGCLENELHGLYGKLKELSVTHSQMEVRELYLLFLQRIEQYFRSVS